MTRTIFYYTDSTSFGGVERAIIQHIQGLDHSLWRAVLVHHPGAGIMPLLQEAAKLDTQLVEMPLLPLGMAGIRHLPDYIAMLNKERPTIFHAHLSWPLACKWGLVAALVTGVPAIFATLQLWVEADYSPAARWQQRMIAKKLGKYIAVSQDIARKLQQSFQIPDSKIQVIHNSVDNQRFKYAVNCPAPHELATYGARSIILTVARLDQQKGLSTLLDAAVQVPDAIFVIVGEGPERKALKKQRQELGLEDRVIFAGFRQDIDAWIGHCNLFVLPSLYEGLPLSLLEAMAAGKPIIATAIPGNDEAVVHAETGWLVPPDDAGALAEAINHLLSNPLLAQKLAFAGQARAENDFSVQAMNQQVMQLYAEQLDKNLTSRRYHE